MADAIERINAAKRTLDQAQRDYDRAEGQKEALLARLHADHGVDTLEDAKALLEKKKKELDKGEARLNSLLNALESALEHYN